MHTARLHGSSCLTSSLREPDRTTSKNRKFHWGKDPIENTWKELTDSKKTLFKGVNPLSATFNHIQSTTGGLCYATVCSPLSSRKPSDLSFIHSSRLDLHRGLQGGWSQSRLSAGGGHNPDKQPVHPGTSINRQPQLTLTSAWLVWERR